MKIAIIENKSRGVSLHRLINPYKYLSHEHDITITNGVMKGQDYDTIIFNRAPNQCITDLEYFKSQGTKIVMDLDDWIELPKYHTEYSPNRIKQIAPILDCIELADVITTSTTRLQKWLKSIGYESEVLLNFIDKTSENNAKEHAIGWVGGQNHAINLSILKGVMENKFDANRILGGYSKNDAQSEFYRRILSGNYKHEIELRSPLSIENYTDLYKGITIGLLPCYDDIFNNCKSDLRALEYASMGIVSLTNGGCYSGTKAIRVEGRTWRKEIEKLIRSKIYFSEKQAEQIEWFKKRNDIKAITEKRKQIIESI